MRKSLIVLFLIVSCQTFAQVQEFILKNGLKLVIQEDHRAPIAVSMLWYKVGSSDEKGGSTGLSHALEHMMFKGTKKFPQGEFSKIIAKTGGQQNAMTNTDYTVFYEKVESSQLGFVFELEADRMHHLEFDAHEFAKEIKVIQEERRLRTDDNPQALAMERFLATAHLAEAYHHPVIGWMTDLQSMDLPDLRQWYKKYYVPNNATLVVVGDVNPETIHSLAQHYFDGLPKKQVKPSKPQIEPVALGKKTVHIQAAVKIPMVLLGYTVPSIKTATHAWEPYALALIASILDVGEGSRFAKNLIRGSHIASSATALYNPYSKYATQFMVTGTPSQNQSIKTLTTGLIAELDTLKTTPLTDIELQRIKNQLIAQKTFEKDSIFSQAMELGLLETIGIGWKRTAEFSQAINDVSALQIQQTARKYFQDTNATQALLQPSTTNEKQL
ncbi:MAG: insulinase family protein [Legionella sp.]|nr:insulinase family protein [Legionella sp.]